MQLSHFNFKKEKAGLCFSGGKDSLACLFLLRDHWNDITVYFTNTGSVFPETELLMERVNDLVPNFVEIRTNQPEDIRQNGWPVDVLPIRNSPDMQEFYTGDRIKMQSFFACCYKNKMLPMYERMIDDGITLIIKGQRKDEQLQSPLRSGDELDGVKLCFPVEDWTAQEVRDYVNKQEIKLPKHYEKMGTSLDCWNCTAYLDETKGKLEYMKENHPQRYKIVSDSLKLIAHETWGDMKHLTESLEVIENARHT